MSVEEKNNKRTFNRRGFMAVGGAFALAGLGLGTGALWSQRDTIADGAISAGNLEVVRGTTTPYVVGLASPETNENEDSGSIYNFYRIDSDTERSFFSSYESSFNLFASWVTDYTFINNGDNMQAAFVPSLNIDMDAMLEYLPADINRDEVSTQVIAGISPSYEHEDHLVFSNSAFAINDNPILYTVGGFFSGASSFGKTPKTLPYDYEEKFAEDGTNIDDVDPTGVYRQFTYNYDESAPSQPISVNIPQGETTISQFILKSMNLSNADYNYSNFIKDGIYEIDDAIQTSFELKQIRG